MADLPTQAMILAAGMGTRMGALTRRRPKAMVPVGDRPLIDHVIDRLKTVGVQRIVVNLHYCADVLESHLTRHNDVEIILSDERGELLDTGGGVLKALNHFGGEPFWTHNCDSIWIEGMGSNLERIGSVWDADVMDALMLLAPTTNSLGYGGKGDFTMDPAGRLQRRPAGHVAPFVWAGVQIVHPRLFDNCPSGAFSTNVLWDRAVESDRLFGHRLDGIWMHVGTPKAVSEAEALMKELMVVDRPNA